MKIVLLHRKLKGISFICTAFIHEIQKRKEKEYDENNRKQCLTMVSYDYSIVTKMIGLVVQLNRENSQDYKNEMLFSIQVIKSA